MSLVGLEIASSNVALIVSARYIKTRIQISTGHWCELERFRRALQASLLPGLTFYNGLSATPHLVENDVCGCFPFKRLGFIVPVGEPLVDRTFQFIYAMEGPAADHAVRDEPE